LLAFSRKQIVEPTRLDLNAVVADMQTMLGRLIGEDVKIVLGVRPELARVKADRAQVEQIVVNLAVNARDAMRSGGRLTIATRNADVNEATAAREVGLRPGAYAALSVTDTGTGMSAETRSHLFEPFFTTKDPDKGTGLGLSTVYGIVEQSGGVITVDSEPGRGTTFTIFLPPVEEMLDVAVPDEAQVSRSTARTVLLVDDEPEVRGLAGEILRRVGYTLLEAGSGEEALTVVDKHGSPIHLLVTDIMMPGMNGRELAERMRSLRPDLRVLYISGYVRDADTRAALLGNQSAFLSKPFTPETLTQKVRELLAAAPH
jgi:two-component system cell cycle sensor histidine kinase/response regulator CckA